MLAAEVGDDVSVLVLSDGVDRVAGVSPGLFDTLGNCFDDVQASESFGERHLEFGEKALDVLLLAASGDDVQFECEVGSGGRIRAGSPDFVFKYLRGTLPNSELLELFRSAINVSVRPRF